MSEALPTWVGVSVAVAAVAGAFLFLASAIGLLRFPDFYTRLHAPTKAATLGLVLIGAASMLNNAGHDASTTAQDVLLIVFFMLTLPVSSQPLARGGGA